VTGLDRGVLAFGWIRIPWSIGLGKTRGLDRLA
jgi:hypothetical protein